MFLPVMEEATEDKGLVVGMQEDREELVYKLLGLLKGLVSMFPVLGLLKVVGMALGRPGERPNKPR